MSPVIFLKLLAIFATIAIGWAAGRTRPFAGGEAARVLSNAAFYVFAPALLFRATARIDLAALEPEAIANDVRRPRQSLTVSVRHCLRRPGPFVIASRIADR